MQHKRKHELQLLRGVVPWDGNPKESCVFELLYNFFLKSNNEINFSAITHLYKCTNRYYSYIAVPVVIKSAIFLDSIWKPVMSRHICYKSRVTMLWHVICWTSVMCLFRTDYVARWRKLIFGEKKRKEKLNINNLTDMLGTLTSVRKWVNSSAEVKYSIYSPRLIRYK